MADTAENQGEELFKLYLDQWGYTDYERQVEWLNPPKKPDFLVRTPLGEPIVELKSFTTSGLFEDAPVGVVQSRPLVKALGPIRSAIKAAAEQLKGIEDRPLVVVLANPENLPLPLNPAMVISAMYGDLAYTFGGPGESEGWSLGRNGRLYVADGQGYERGFHDYVSAVALISDGVKAWGETWWDEHGASYESPAAALPDFEAAWREAPQPRATLDVFETVSDRCVPLPADLFFHEGDTRWGEIGPGQYGLKASATA